MNVSINPAWHDHPPSDIRHEGQGKRLIIFTGLFVRQGLLGIYHLGSLNVLLREKWSDCVYLLILYADSVGAP